MLRLFLMLALVKSLTAGTYAPPRILAVDINGVVHPITVEMIAHALDRAKHQNAALVLVRINSPGGMLDTAREIVEKVAASPVPVVTYVTPSTAGAASAGFIVLESGAVAAMSPGTYAGAAHPLTIPQMDPALRLKMENDAAAAVRAIVARSGRNAALAQEAVLKSRSFTDQEALANHLIDLVARNEQDLLGQLDGREIIRFDGKRQMLRVAGALIADYQETVRENILSRITDPNLAFVLLVLGALGIYVEFNAPGLILPGVAGGILVLLGLAAITLLPINWVGAALIALAGVLFILEAKIASHGILGTGGAVALVLGAMLLIDSPFPETRIQLSVALGVALPFAVIVLMLTTLVLRARRARVVTGSEGMIGQTGVAVGPLSPSGKVFVHGEYWDAVSVSPISDGLPVRVTGVERLTLHVKPSTEKPGG